jgi:DNA-binding Lrp family transcriptional regulator
MVERGVEEREVDELDMTLLDALHVNPRARFEQLGPAIGVSPVTAARRWRRLVEHRQAWVSTVPGPRLELAAAVFDLECAPARAGEVSRALAELPWVASVYQTAGPFDVCALVFASGMGPLSTLLLDRLGTIPGITRARSHIVTDWYSDVRWRLGAISESAERTVEPAGALQHGSEPRGERFDDTERAIYLALQDDGRASYVDLADQLGLSEQLVKRRLTSLANRGALAFRTDFVRTDGGWPTQLMLMLQVPDVDLRAVADVVTHWPETRICLSVLGPANLFVKLQMHRLADVQPLFERIHSGLPGGVVADRRLVLRPVKSWGRLLDDQGRCAGVVPVNLWADC